MIFASNGGGVMALAITPRGELGDLPNCGKASSRGVRPWLTPVPIAGKKSLTSGDDNHYILSIVSFNSSSTRLFPILVA